MAVLTGLSGNEIYCLHLKGLKPGNLVIGNSIYSLGFVGGLGTGFKTMLGGEVTQVTDLIRDGRESAYRRMVQEARQEQAIGITGVSSELVYHSGNIEFLSIGSGVNREEADPNQAFFSTAADGQELYCQEDAGFTPLEFVLGNVAYSTGIGGGIMGALRSFGRGEVVEYSNIFNRTRHLALERIMQEAMRVKANAVVGIRTSILPIMGMQEMVMIGTASRHAALHPAYNEQPITSDLTNEEMWNLIHLGYMPLRLVLGALAMQKIHPAKALLFNAFMAMSLVIVTIFSEGEIAKWSILGVGLFNSIMFPTLFSLAVKNLGRHTGQGSGIICAAIVGGAILPPIQGIFADSIGIQHAFFVPALGYLYICYYGWKGHEVK